MWLCGEPYHPGNTVDAMDRGVSMVVQEQGTISKISIAANIFFGKEHLFVRGGVLNVRRMNAEARRALEDIGVTGMDPAQLIDTLSFEDRKLVELARALYSKPEALDRRRDDHGALDRRPRNSLSPDAADARRGQRGAVHLARH